MAPGQIQLGSVHGMMIFGRSSAECNTSCCDHFLCDSVCASLTTACFQVDYFDLPCGDNAKLAGHTYDDGDKNLIAICLTAEIRLLSVTLQTFQTIAKCWPGW